MTNRWMSVFLLLLFSTAATADDAAPERVVSASGAAERLGAGTAAADDGFDEAVVFNSRCGACHTVGRGDDVGPDLQGVTERHDRAWLVSFIQSSQRVIGAGDPTATELFERYGRQKMPDHPYTAQQIDEILAYIESGGPAASRLRPASDATAEDIHVGRDLFFGRTGRGMACAACHTTGAAGGLPSGYLGGSLAQGFTKYHDVELARVLARPRSVCDRVLEAEDSFHVRAYLRHVAQQGGEARHLAGFFPWLGIGLAALMLSWWSRRPGALP